MSETFSLTSVTWDASGAPEVNVRRITRQEQLALAAARSGQMPREEGGVKRQAMIVDAGCTSPYSMWLYDGPSQTGNMLCLLPEPLGVGDGARLKDYFRAVLGTCPLCYNADWARAVRSYWTPRGGSAPYRPWGAGWFQGPIGPNYCLSNWVTDESQHEADACTRRATSLEIHW